MEKLVESLHVVIVCSSFVSRIQDFGQDGGGALKALDPKFDLFMKNVNETLNLNLSLPGRVEVYFHI